MTTYISVACTLGRHTDDDLPNGSPFGSIPPCSCECHTVTKSLPSEQASKDTLENPARLIAPNEKTE